MADLRQGTPSEIVSDSGAPIDELGAFVSAALPSFERMHAKSQETEMARIESMHQIESARIKDYGETERKRLEVMAIDATAERDVRIEVTRSASESTKRVDRAVIGLALFACAVSGFLILKDKTGEGLLVLSHATTGALSFFAGSRGGHKPKESADAAP